MAVDNRPFKSKEQDGQGNEVIIRDQQLVEQGTTTTMPAGTYFQTLDVDGRPVKIPKDNMLNLIVEGLGIIFNGQTDQQIVTKVPTLNGNNFGASTVATLASVLGAKSISTSITSNGSYEIKIDSRKQYIMGIVCPGLAGALAYIVISGNTAVKLAGNGNTQTYISVSAQDNKILITNTHSTTVSILIEISTVGSV